MILKNSMWAATGNLVFALSQGMLLISLNMIGDINSIAAFAIASAVTAPIFTLFQFGMRSQYLIDTQHCFSGFFYARVILTAIGFCVSIVAATFTEYMLAVALFAIFKVSDSIFDIVYAKHQKQGQLKLIATSRLLRSALNVITFTIALVYLGFTEAMASLALIGLACVMIGARNVGSLPSPRFVDMVTITKKSAPLGIAAFVISLNSNIPRYLLESIGDASSLAAFSTFIYIVTSYGMVISSICQAFTAPMFEAFGTKVFIKLAAKMNVVCAALACVFVAVMLLIESFIFTEIINEGLVKYSSMYRQIIFASPLYFISISLGVTLTCYRKTKLQPLLFTLTAVITIFICITPLQIPIQEKAVVVMTLSWVLGIIGTFAYGISKFK